MKLTRKLGVFFTVLIMMCSMSLCVIPAHALTEAFFTLPDRGAVNKGDDFSITLTFSSTDSMGDVSAKVAYDTTALTFTGGTNASGGDGIIIINGNASGSSDVTYTLNFKGTAASRGAQINIISSTVNTADGSSAGSPMAYANITVVDNGSPAESSSPTQTSSQSETTPQATQAPVSTESEKPSSSDIAPPPAVIGGRLSSLTIDNGKLTPDFSPDVFEYTVNVDYDVTNVEVQANPANPADYVWYSGSSECQVGENVRTITVNDAYGNETVYTITVIRAQQNMVTTVSEPLQTKHIPTTKANVNDDTLRHDKSLLNSALIIILIVLVMALVVIIFWIRNKIKGNKSK